MELVPYENSMHYKNIHQGSFSGKSKKSIHIQYEVLSLACLKSIFFRTFLFSLLSPCCEMNIIKPIWLYKIKSRLACMIVVFEGNSKGNLGQYVKTEASLMTSVQEWSNHADQACRLAWGTPTPEAESELMCHQRSLLLALLDTASHTLKGQKCMD